MSEPLIDWDAWTEQATTWLSDYIRIDTVNPPGNETRACEWLGAILDAEDVPYETYTPYGREHRQTLVARLPGDGTGGKALVLLNHTDVVPFERSHWTVEPLGGEIRDGYVWGRGAQDMKGMGIMELVTFLLHKRHHLPLTRDLVFIAVADEEAGSEFGAEFLGKEHPDLLDCEYVINEGGGGSTEVLGVQRNTFNIGVAEKGPFWVTLRATGRPGHGSVPHDDNAADRLVRALHRLQTWERPLQPSPEVREYFRQLREAGILDRDPTDAVLAEIAAINPRMRSIQMNSISLTTLNAGVKHNVIPATAEATLDVRLIPGYDPAQFMQELKAVIDDDQIEVEEVFVSASPSSPMDTDLYRVMSREVRNAVEDAVIVPGVSTGFTDSRVFRRHGITAYGFVPTFTEPADQGRVHGNDERLSIENLRLGLQILHHTVRGICG
ncbi:MAG: M20/M25/M40 family metallo-hydrolase [Chloroflexi bacterium]|nr:M20/M25/M40 family metallo-hydrolase [Chloroflexota bacterium]MQC47969.1 M20/M25/M40 family metallo-hydrolase [Chloroflexota bacterium]